MPESKLRHHRRSVIVIGCDDIGSAIACVLHRAGAAVVVVDTADPPWACRGRSYTDAWYVGGATLDAIDACFCGSVKSIPAILDRGDMIAATTWSWEGVAASLDPVAVIDTRPERATPRRGAPARIAARRAGDRRGDDAGRRMARRCRHRERPVATMAGVLTALAARGARIGPGHTLAEIDSRRDGVNCFGITPEARAIAHRVAAALRNTPHAPSRPPAAIERHALPA